MHNALTQYMNLCWKLEPRAIDDGHGRAWNLLIHCTKENRSDGNKSNAAARYGGIPIKELARLGSGKGVTRYELGSAVICHIQELVYTVLGMW